MEGVFFVLIGGSLFSYAWYVLGLYPDGRTMGLFTGGLGLASLIALTLAPMVLIGGDPDANILAEHTVMKMLIVVWASFAVGMAAHGLWDLDDRAIGFFGAMAAAASAVAFFYYAPTLANAYGDAVAISISTACLVLAGLAGVMFFCLAIPFNTLRLVAAWSLLLGSITVAGIGWAIMSTLIEAT